MIERRLAVSLPLRDGLLQRQCPACRLLFAIDPSTAVAQHTLNLRCPRCGGIERADEYATDQQIAYTSAHGENELYGTAEKAIQDMLNKAFGTLGTSKFVRVKPTGRPQLPATPIPSPFSEVDLAGRGCTKCQAIWASPSDDSKSDCPFCR